MAILRVWDDGRWKDIAEDDFPLAVGVSPEGAIMFGHALQSPAAWIGLNNHQLFLQTAGGPRAVQLNGSTLERSEWLIAGDRIQIDTTECTLNADSGVFVLSPGIRGYASRARAPGCTAGGIRSCAGNYTSPQRSKNCRRKLRSAVFRPAAYRPGQSSAA